MLSNAYFLTKFRFDTAENEPAKNLQNVANFANPDLHEALDGLRDGQVAAPVRVEHVEEHEVVRVADVHVRQQLLDLSGAVPRLFSKEAGLKKKPVAGLFLRTS